MKTFIEALKDTKKSERTLLIGNGFSIAQTKGSFSYANLLDESGITDDSPIRKVFASLDTVDFEEIIQSIEHAKIVVNAYGERSLFEKLSEDANSVREALISAIHKVHPNSYAAINIENLESCSAFLRNFKEVYTLNYDLLLYWVNLHGEIFADGFGLGTRNGNFLGPFNEKARCHIYNVHGGLHLFPTKTREVQKLTAKSGYLLDEIGNVVKHEKQFPIFVAEGSSEEKINKIRSVPYLHYCYNKLSRLRGSLIIVGHSASPRDSHIYDALFSSDLSEIYFCVHNPTKNLHEIRERLAPFQTRNRDISVSFVDGDSVDIWEAHSKENNSAITL
jgi:hypothetical protein